MQTVPVSISFFLVTITPVTFLLTGYEDHFINGHRIDPSTLNISPLNFRFPATVPLKAETHAGEDVGIWSTGASSYLFSGVLEQSMIPHIMAYAACIGDGLKICDSQK